MKSDIVNKPPGSFHAMRFIMALSTPFFPIVYSRLGRLPDLEGTIPPRIMKETIDPPKKPSIWLHAVSVGEIEAALPIARRIISEYGADHLLITTNTREGNSVAVRKLEGLKYIQYFPFDLPRIIRKFLDHFSPSLYVCLETELWPNITHELNLRGIPMILVNARVSDRLNNTYAFLRPLYRWMFLSNKWISVQTEEDLRRLKKFAPDLSFAEITGNTKFDLPNPNLAQKDLNALKKQIGLREGPIVVFGSTHHGEEEIVADVFNSLKKKHSKIAMILAPRHIERSDDVAKILQQRGIKFNRRTDTLKGVIADQNADCLLLDTVGELTMMYTLGRMAYVGGSLTKRGGHNLLEPAAAGVPVIHGPHMDNFRVITSFLHNAGAAIQVENQDELEKCISELLNDDTRINDMRKKAFDAYSAGKGATDKIMAKIRELMPKGA
jgi:3-deoxy-D-manno-octulosonic-acid transferase